MYDATKVMKQNVYKAYTDILKKTNPKPFIDGVQTDFKNLVHKLNNKLLIENSIDGQKAIATLIREIRDARDLSPTGLQSYVERLNARSQGVFNGGSPAALANESAAVASDVRDIISKNIENLKGEEYKQLRSLYGAYKTIEKDTERSARNYINKTGNKLFEGASNIVSGADTLLGLVTHDPMSIIRGMAIKGAEKANAYLKSPERNLKKMFDEVENVYNVANKKVDFGTPSTRINTKPETVVRPPATEQPLTPEAPIPEENPINASKAMGAGGVALATGASSLAPASASEGEQKPSVKDKINSFLGKETYQRPTTPEEDLAGIKAVTDRALKSGVVTDVPGDMPTQPTAQSTPSGVVHAPEKGILEGVDITKWATDPNHEKNSARIYKLMPEVATSSEIDQYIKSKAPKAKITGQMVLKAAHDYNVPIKVVLTIAQQDSMFATKGLGKRTNNPMNWGNDDSGRIAKFKRVEDGLRRGIEQLSKFKVD
jgi:hypothetical protein